MRFDADLAGHSARTAGPLIGWCGFGIRSSLLGTLSGHNFLFVKIDCYLVTLSFPQDRVRLGSNWYPYY